MSDFENEIVSEQESVNETSINEQSSEQESVNDESVNSNSVEFVTLKNFPLYEIATTYPHQIRKKSNKRIVSECRKDNEYIYVHLDDGNKHHLNRYKHRLIAEQFIPNPNNYNEIDHRNCIRDDNHLSNLRWCSHSENLKNRASYRGYQYEYVDELPEGAIVVNEYGNNQFEDYYFADNIFFFFNGIKYRKLHINENKKGSKFVYLMNTNNKTVTVCYSKFKRLYDLL